MSSTDKQKKLFEFLKSNQSESFPVSKIQDYTGYTSSTIKTYIKKKLINYLLVKEFKDIYRVNDRIKLLTLDEFTAHMSQTSKKCLK